MRDSVSLLLRKDADPLASDEADTLIRTLRGHMELMIPEVEYIAGKLGKDDIRRYCALACIGEARGKLRAEPLAGNVIARAQKFARSLNALCDHWETLHGVHPGAGQ